MGSFINEYHSKLWSMDSLKQELNRLIKAYNDQTGSYLIIYCADIAKAGLPGIPISMEQDDYYMIHDLLREVKSEKLDFYLQTPGGRGECAEEIAMFIQGKFKHINFVIAGEAKSAGTILALCGDDISMTDTGSLGPIDAQIRIGRFQVSAHDYLEWVEEKRTEAATNGKLNPFDAAMVAQISPGELKGVAMAFAFAQELVSEWLPKRKFKNWSVTSKSKKPVTEDMKINRAKEIAKELCDHGTWKMHGKSLKASDLQPNLKINRIDDDAKLADIVYRIKTVLRMVFETSGTFKVFQTVDNVIWRTYVTGNIPGQQTMPILPSGVPVGKAIGSAPVNLALPFQIQMECNKCGRRPQFIGVADNKIKVPVAALKFNDRIDAKGMYLCECGNHLDTKTAKNNLELQIKRPINFPKTT